MNPGVPSGLTPPLSSLFASSLVGSVMKQHKEAVTLSRCPLGSSRGPPLCVGSIQRTCSLRSGVPTPAPEGFRAPFLSGGGGGQCHASRDIAHILREGVEGCQPVSQAKPAWNALEAGFLPPGSAPGSGSLPPSGFCSRHPSLACYLWAGEGSSGAAVPFLPGSTLFRDR